MTKEKFTFGSSKIAVVIADMADRNPSVRKTAQRINDKYAALARAISLGVHWKFFGELLYRHAKAEIEGKFSGAEQSHLLNFLTSKKRTFLRLAALLK